MKRPYVICHMMETVDGRIQTERWSLSPAAEKQYEAVHALHRADAWMCGRQTFQGDFLEQKKNAVFSRKAKVPAGDFIVAEPPVVLWKKGRSPAKVIYAVAVDASGKLRWESADMRGDQLIVLTTLAAPAGYLADLRAKSISYLLCGKAEIDFASALTRLHRHYGIRKLMLEGGGGINGALLEAGLIDELSVLVCPFADGTIHTPTLFDQAETKASRKATALRLISVSKRPGDVLWLRYRTKR